LTERTQQKQQQLHQQQQQQQQLQQNNFGLNNFNPEPQQLQQQPQVFEQYPIQSNQIPMMNMQQQQQVKQQQMAPPGMMPQQPQQQQQQPQPQYMMSGMNQPQQQPMPPQMMNPNQGNVGTNMDPMSALKTMSSTNQVPDSMQGMIQRHTVPPQQPHHPPMNMGPNMTRGPRVAGPYVTQGGMNYMPNSPANAGMMGHPQQQHSMYGGPGTPMSGASPRPAFNAGMIPSPASMASGMGYSGVTLNTPIMPSHVSSPGGVASPQNEEHKMKLQKLAQLSKFIEPLKHTIEKIEVSENIRDMQDNKKEVAKIKHLLEIISEPSSVGRVTLDTLIKCENVLVKMDLKIPRPPLQEPNGGNQLTRMLKEDPQPVLTQPISSMTSSSNPCQPLLDVITANLKKPGFQATLSRTFSPAAAALGIIPTNSTISMFRSSLPDLMDTNSSSNSSLSPPMKKKRKNSHDSSEDSDSEQNSKCVLEGEIARLDPKFKVEEDPLSHPDSRSTQVLVYLDSPDLPYVPPITVRIPDSYPSQPPSLVMDNPFVFSLTSNIFDVSSSSQESDGVDNFFNRVQSQFDLNCRKLPATHSFTSLLQTWELSVRQASSQPRI
jgi:mediator of RNA polymerase II transcription subunit 15